MENKNIWLILGLGAFIMLWYWVVIPSLPEEFQPSGYREKNGAPVQDVSRQADSVNETTSAGEASKDPSLPPKAGLAAPDAPVPSGNAAVRNPQGRPAVEIKEFTVETGFYRVLFDNRGGVISKLWLKTYHPDPKSGEAMLLLDAVAFAHDDKRDAMLTELSTDQGSTIVRFLSDGVEKIFTFTPEGKNFLCEIRSASGGGFSLRLPQLSMKERDLKTGAVYAGSNRTFKENSAIHTLDSFLEKPQRVLMPAGVLQWAGFRNKYFLCVAEPLSALDCEIGIDGGKDGVSMLIKGNAAAAKFRIQACPASEDLLLPLGESFRPFFDYYGPDVFIHFFLWLLTIIESLPFVNMGFAILIMTVLVRACLFPLNLKAQGSMYVTQQLAPEIKKLQEKYKNDRQVLTQEMMKFQKEHGYNPLSGCLPVLIQFPIFISLFSAIGEGFALRHAPFMLWINDMSAPDRITTMPFGIPLIGNADGTTNVNILIFLYLGTSLVQQMMMPKSTDPQQQQAQKMFKIMIFVFAFMLYNYSCGLMLYWTASNTLSIAESWYIRKHVLPRLAEERKKKAARN